MKRFILIVPFLLSGCFMYNNFKCSIEGTCSEYQSEQTFEMSQKQIAEQELENKKIREESARQKKEKIEYTQKARTLISQRCILFGWKKGTAKYALCNKARFNSYQASVYLDSEKSYKKAYEAMVERYKRDEKNCIEYGVKRGTSEFNECRIQFEQDYFERMSKQLERERQQIDNTIYQPVFSSSPRHCSSHRIGDSFYTDCY